MKLRAASACNCFLVFLDMNYTARVVGLPQLVYHVCFKFISQIDSELFDAMSWFYVDTSCSVYAFQQSDPAHSQSNIASNIRHNSQSRKLTTLLATQI